MPGGPSCAKSNVFRLTRYMPLSPYGIPFKDMGARLCCSVLGFVSTVTGGVRLSNGSIGKLKGEMKRIIRKFLFWRREFGTY